MNGADDILRPASDEETFENWYGNPEGYRAAARLHSAHPWQNDDGAIRIILNVLSPVVGAEPQGLLLDYIHRLHNGVGNYGEMEYGCDVNLPKQIKWFCDRYQVPDENNYLEQLTNRIERLRMDGVVDNGFLAQSIEVIEEVRTLCATIQERIRRESDGLGLFIDVDNLPGNWRI